MIKNDDSWIHFLSKDRVTDKSFQLYLYSLLGRYVGRYKLFINQCGQMKSSPAVADSGCLRGPWGEMSKKSTA